MLGPLVVIGGDDSPVLGPTQRRLLALLAVRAGTVVTADQIGDVLDLETAGAVRTAVWRLRRVVGDLISGVPPGYMLDAACVDVARFEGMVRRATAAAPSERVELLAAALGMWRGEALVEFADDEWARGEAVRLEELRWSATEDRIEALLTLGRGGEAAAAANLLISLQPLRERARGLYMAALSSQGRTAEALHAYHDYRSYLAEELGTEPSAELAQLERQILHGDASHPSVVPTAALEEPSRPTGTVTFLFTDIEDFAQRWEVEPDVMSGSLDIHDEIVRGAIHSHDGHVFSTSNGGFGATFDRAADAVAAAAMTQRALRDAAWPGAAVTARIGVHTGEATERGGDYVGAAVNLAARLMEAGHGGQTLVSETTAQMLQQSVPLADLGEHRLRDVALPLRIRQLHTGGAEVTFPPLRSHAQGNLVRAATRWIGPDEDLDRRAALVREHRLVTLAGAGGVGKTRLAVELGFSVAADFTDGVWFVDLAPLIGVDSIFTEVVATLSIPFSPTPITTMVVDWLRDRHLMIILDNCEHLLAPVVDFVNTIRGRCPSVVILTTSREPLGVAGERVVRVASMSGDDAVTLFCERATDADESLTLTPDDLASVGAICAHLDGIPLAIELAAARMQTATPEDLLVRLQDRFAVLRSRTGTRLERHQTLRATVSWSYQLLDPDQQLLFDRLSVFAGGFDLLAAQAVCADDTVPADVIVDMLDALVNKSMVGVDRSGGGIRYRLLETLRAFAGERLTSRGDVVAVRDRFLDHYLEHLRIVPYDVGQSPPGRCQRRVRQGMGQPAWRVQLGGRERAAAHRGRSRQQHGALRMGSISPRAPGLDDGRPGDGSEPRTADRHLRLGRPVALPPPRLRRRHRAGRARHPTITWSRRPRRDVVPRGDRVVPDRDRPGRRGPRRSVRACRRAWPGQGSARPSDRGVRADRGCLLERHHRGRRPRSPLRRVGR